MTEFLNDRVAGGTRQSGNADSCKCKAVPAPPNLLSQDTEQIRSNTQHNASCEICRVNGCLEAPADPVAIATKLRTIDC